MIAQRQEILAKADVAQPSTWLLRMLHFAFVAFLYLNVLFPKLTMAGLSVSKAAFTASLLLFGLYAVLNSGSRHSTSYGFIGTAFAMISFLAVVGVIKGNRMPDILIFVSPLLMLLGIPLIQLLTQHYGKDSYIKHIAISATLLAGYMVYLYLAKGPLGLPDDSLLLPEQPGFTSVSFPGGVPKVIAVTAGFFPAGLVAAYYLAATVGLTRYYVSIILLTAGVYIGQTMGIWIASVFALFTGALFIRSSSLVRSVILWTTIPLIAVVTVGNAIARGDVLDPSRVFETKIDSIDQKQLQTLELLAVFIESPVLGRGLGYNYQLTEITSLSDFESLFVEASYSMLLASTGIVGAMCYGFIYLYYPLVYFSRPKKRNGPTTVIAIGHCAVLIASAGLPYLWSGGIGFLFLSFLIAWVELPLPANEVASASARAVSRRQWLQPLDAVPGARLAGIHTGTVITRRQVGVDGRP